MMEINKQVRLHLKNQRSLTRVSLNLERAASFLFLARHS